MWCAALVTAAGTIAVVVVIALAGTFLHDAARPPSPPPGAPLGGPAAARVRAAAGQQGDIVGHTLSDVRLIGLIVVGGLALVSIGIGWLVAGRMLRPVSRLADVAREVSDTSLHRRIALDGPDDELRALADAIDAMLDRLDRAFASQQRFVADASHELRTPLATIRAEVEATLDDPAATREEIRAVSQRISGVLDRADALVSALLLLSRSEVISVRAAVDLGELTRDVITATPGTADLDVRAALEPAPVAGDPALLERLAGNLVENAVRYNRPGGVLEVTTASSMGAGVLTVVNDGPIVPGDMLGSLVERFHRGERTSGGGFGLGLAIAEAITRGHGGNLSLQARPQGGLCARVELPLLPVGDRSPGRAAASLSDSRARP